MRPLVSPANCSPAPSRPSGYPDFEYIRNQIPISAIAQVLGIRVCNGWQAHCWRTENHKHGDRTPSLSFWRKKNKAQCFFCDVRAYSTIDLVCLYHNGDTKTAAQWITDHFEVPRLSKGPAKRHTAWSPLFRASNDGDSLVTMLIRCGLWQELTHEEQGILPLFEALADPHTRIAELSYPELLRRSGVGGRATVAKAIRHFEQWGILRVARRRGEMLMRRVNRYTLTVDDPKFRALLADAIRRQSEMAELEREFRAEENLRKRRNS